MLYLLIYIFYSEFLTHMLIIIIISICAHMLIYYQYCALEIDLLVSHSTQFIAQCVSWAQNEAFCSSVFYHFIF